MDAPLKVDDNAVLLVHPLVHHRPWLGWVFKANCEMPQDIWDKLIDLGHRYLRERG
jgi:hypothetical protein